jgi:hypothetical protein
VRLWDYWKGSYTNKFSGYELSCLKIGDTRTRVIFDIKISNAYLSSVIQQSLWYLWYDRPIQNIALYLIWHLSQTLYVYLRVSSCFRRDIKEYLCISHLIYRIPLRISGRISKNSLRMSKLISCCVSQSLRVHQTWHLKAFACHRSDVPSFQTWYIKARPHYSCSCYSRYTRRVNIRILTRRNLASNWSSVDEDLRAQVKARRVSRRAQAWRARARVMWTHKNICESGQISKGLLRISRPDIQEPVEYIKAWYPRACCVYKGLISKSLLRISRPDIQEPAAYIKPDIQESVAYIKAWYPRACCVYQGLIYKNLLRMYV